MRRLRITDDGGALALEEVPVPSPGAREVTIDVAFSGVNLKDVKQRGGAATASRSDVVYPGFEVSGHVREVGEAVTDLRAGQPVVARPIVGGYADVAVARRELVVVVPGPDDEAPLRDAAASFIATSTALLLLEELGRLRPQESLLVHGAAGAVGSALGQVATYLELDPIIGTVGSEGKRDVAVAQGYTHALLRDGFDDEVRRITDGRGVTAVADPLGGDVRRASFDVLAPMGRLLAFGRTGTDDEGLPEGTVLRSRNLSYQGMSFGSLSDAAPELSQRVVARAVELIVSGTVRVPVYAEYPLPEANDALDALGSRTTTGKLLLKT